MLNLTPDQFGKMTPGEFHKKIQGFYDYQKQQVEINQKLALYQAWHIGYFCAYSFGGMKDYPKLKDILSNEPKQETEEDLFELAKEKGIEVPEGK
jgi:hypothetical protein